jgi:hypothetical protein
MSNKIVPCKLSLTPQNGLCIYRSADWTLAFKISEREGLVDTPIDLSGYTARGAIKKFLTDETPMVEMSVDCDEEGNIVASLPAELTKNILVKGKNFCDTDTFQYEIQLVDTETGEVFRSLYGDVIVVGSVYDSNDNN